LRVRRGGAPRRADGIKACPVTRGMEAEVDCAEEIGRELGPLLDLRGRGARYAGVAGGGHLSVVILATGRDRSID
jgi:hypothetical protein